MARDPFPPGTVVRWGDSPHLYTVWSAHKKARYRWLTRDGSKTPVQAGIANLTVVTAAPADAPKVREHPVAPARVSDPATSKAAALAVRPGNQRHLILGAYRGDGIWTDAEAADRVGLLGTRSCWWKRCSELREGGYVEVVGTASDPVTGALAQTCRITEKGLAAL